METAVQLNKDFWFACVDIDVIRDKKLSQTAKFIFTVLCSFAGWNSRGCWPSNKVLAEIADVSERTVIRAYKELEERGVISRSARFKDKAQTTSYTHIIGHKAPCYENEENTTAPLPAITDGADTGDVKPLTPMPDRTIPKNDIKDSLKGEAKLPNFTERPVKGNTYHIPKKQTVQGTNPKEAYTLEDAPDIMRTTAEFFLHKTGRQGLMWSEISALRQLAATQYPIRVQKEICTAVNRFLKRGQSLGALTFGYIAGSLENQPTWGEKQQFKRNPLSLTQAQIDATREHQSEEELDRELEELMAELRAEEEQRYAS